MAEDTKVDFFSGDYARPVAGAAPIIQKNRYFEIVPNFSQEGSSLVARPGMRYLTTVGQGPNRGTFSEEGSFNGDLFVAQFDTLWRLNNQLVAQDIFTGLFNPERGTVNMTVTAPIGNEVPEYLFFADGRNLFIYTENGYATGTINGVPANGDVVRIGSFYYQFTNGSVDAGTPDGTVGNPWLVKVGLTSQLSWIYLYGAVDGDAGAEWTTDITANPDVQSIANSATSLTVEANVAGAMGNGVVTTETGAGIAWEDATLTGGGTAQVRPVDMPEDLGAVDVVTLNSYVFVLPVQIDEFKGRVYYIQPGETTVDPLDYFTAERSPDGVNGMEVLGDLLWLPGDGSTEAWYVSQDPEARMQRMQGVVFDRGTWEGTAVAIHEAMIVVDATGAVFEITGTAPKRISNPGIEEEIRRAIAYQLLVTP